MTIDKFVADFLENQEQVVKKCAYVNRLITAIL